MQVADGAVGVDCCEGEVAYIANERRLGGVVRCDGGKVGAPTLAVVSVRLLRVVDLPEEGLPTRATSGSRGMVVDREWRDGFGG